MRLRKAAIGTLSVAFFLLLCQGARLAAQSLADTVVCDTAWTWGIFLPFFLMLPLTFAALLFFGVQWWREEDPALVWMWPFLFSGGASNLLERILSGCVTDYIVLPFLPVFNAADVMLTIGAVGVFLNLTLKNIRKINYN